MKLVSALVGVALLGGVALSTGAASAMPATIPGQASQASNVEQADYVCNGWGHCWHRPAYGDGYYPSALLRRLGLASRLGRLGWLDRGWGGGVVAPWLGRLGLAPLASLAQLVTEKGASAPFFFGDIGFRCRHGSIRPACLAYSKLPLLFRSKLI